MTDTVVFKYHVPVGGGVTLPLPVGSKVVHVNQQHDDLFLWVRQPTDALMDIGRRFVCKMTGQRVDAAAEYLGTAHIQGGRIVVHVFEEPSL